MWERVRIVGRFGEQFLLIHRHAREMPRPFVRLEKLEPETAARIVLSTLIDNVGHPHWELLEVLGVTEHPYNLDREDLAAIVRQRVGEPHALLVVYRERFAPARMRVKEAVVAVDEPAVGSSPPATFIVVETVNRRGIPVAGVRFEIVLPDGETRTGATGSDGRCVLDLPARGMCQIRLRQLDGRRWRPLEGAPKSVSDEAPQPRPYVVRDGDSLSSIAHAHGLYEWTQIWEHEDNRELRARRKSPHVLHPGDPIAIPAPTIEQITRATGATHRIEVVEPSLELLVVLCDHHGRPFKNQPYEVRVGGAVSDERALFGCTDGEGLVRAELPAGTSEVLVTLTKQGVTWPIVLSAVRSLPNSAPRSDEPGLDVQQVRALQTRLNALGIPSGPADGRLGPQTEAALLQLRRARGDASMGPLTDDDLHALERFGV